MTSYRLGPAAALAALLLLLACTAPEPIATPTAAPSTTPTAGPVSPATPSPSATPREPIATPAPPPTRTPVVAMPTPAAAPRTPSPPPASTATIDPHSVQLDRERVGDGFVHPLLITHAGDGSGRLFIAEKIGRVRLLDGTIFLDITDRVTSPPLFSYEREQGFLGMAFHPRFAENGYFYVHYNDRRGDHVVSRFRVGTHGRADRASEKVLLTQHQPGTNFNGGMLAFGPDGYLYIGFGTGGADIELQANAADLSSLLGKILRIDVDRGDPYAIPPDNPFIGRAGARPEIWAYGLRNPWRFSFDRATGDLYLGIPGEFKREWINLQPAGTPGGRNFGWPILEGSICWRAETCDRTGLELPIIEYPTYEEGNCAIIGGYVYRGPRYPFFHGAYVFGDFCSGRIWAAARDASGRWVTAQVHRLSGLISSFGEDEAGELYVADIHNGVISRLVPRRRQ